MDRQSQLLTKAEVFYNYGRRDANAEARRLYNEVIKLDPSRLQTYADLAYAELTAWLYNWDPDMTDLEQTLGHAQTAATGDPTDYYYQWILADVYLYKKEFGLARDTHEIARNLVSQQAVDEEAHAVHVDWADMLLLTGDAKQAISLVTTAIDQCHCAERWFHWVLGWAYYADGQYQQSLDVLNKLGNPRNARRKNVIANLVALDRTDEADDHAKKYLKEEKDQGITFNTPGGPVWPAMEKIEDRVPFEDGKKLALWKHHLEKVFSKQVAP